MDVKEVLNEGLKRKFEVKILKAVIEQKADDQIEEVKGTFSLPGFRKGHVPAESIKKMYGARFIEDVKRSSVNDIIKEIEEKNKIKIAGTPKVDIKDGDREVEYTLEFEVFPEIQSVDLSTISVDVKNPVISVDEIETEMNNVFAAYNNKWDHVEREARDGDKVRIKYIARFNKKIVDQRENDIRMGDMPEFDKNILGKKIGDKVEFDYQFKKDGKEGRIFHYNVEIVDIFAPGKYESIDEEFLTASGFKSLDEFKQIIKDRLQHDADLLFVQKKSDMVIDALLDKVNFDSPKIFEDMEFRYVVQDFSKGNIVLPRNVDVKNDKGEIDQEKLMKELRAIANKRIKIRLLINKIGEDLGIEVSDKEVTKRARSMNIPESKMTDDMDANIRLQIFEEKVCEAIENKIKINQEDVNVKTFKEWLGLYEETQETPSTENNNQQN